jgi:hypothetical protein
LWRRRRGHIVAVMKLRIAALLLLTLWVFVIPSALAAGKVKRPALPKVVYIRFQLSESFQRVSPGTGNVQSSATIDEVQAIKPHDLKRDSIIPALRLRSAGITARTPGSNGATCDYTGKLASGAEPEIGLRHARNKIYGLVPWPDQVGGNWSFKTVPTGCPSSPSFSPLQGPTVLSSPGVPFSAIDRFYDAIFPISVPKGQRKIKVSMSSDAVFTGETDQTRANGLITISYGRCPTGVKRCKPTNGKP